MPQHWIEIEPHRGLSPDDYRRLGEILDCLLGPAPGIDDMLAGELPKPLIRRFGTTSHRRK